MVTSFKRSPASTASLRAPRPCSRSPLTHISARDSWTLMGKSGSVSWGRLLLSSGSWCTQGSVCALQEFLSPVLCKFWQLYGGISGDLLQEGLCHTQVCCTQSPCPCSKPLPTRTSAGDTQTLIGRSGSVSVGSPGAHKVLFEPSWHLQCSCLENPRDGGAWWAAFYGVTQSRTRLK